MKCAHGMMPVPAPATAEIVTSMPVKTGLVEYEATTPTGAAILAATVNSFSSEVGMVISKTGYGIGHKDGDIPNALRAYLGESEIPKADKQEIEDLQVEEAFMLECNIDDMNPEWYSHVTSLLFEAGAADVFVIPIVMKKSRPGHILSVLSSGESIRKVKDILFRETTSIGLREYRVEKSMLRREVVPVATKYGEVEVKRSYYRGSVVNEKPEFEQCSRLAKEQNITLEEIRKEVYKHL